MSIIDEDSVPSTVKAAVDRIVAEASEHDRNAIRAHAVTEYGTHHVFGKMLRNAWSLWEIDTPIKRDAVNNYGIAHAGDISGLISAWAFALIRDEPFDPMKHVEVYHEHWDLAGTNSLAAGGWTLDGPDANAIREEPE